VPSEITTRPLVSVILSMEDHRGLAIDSARSWIESQDSEPHLFEVILVIDHGSQDLESPLRKILRPHDRLITTKSRNKIEQYDIGARQAGGEFLFFTEPHCFAAPDAVTEIIRTFQTGGLDGFCVRSISINRNRLARMEGRMYEEGFREWSRDGDWRKVIIRGFGIRRSAYLQSGGFPCRYERFAEWLFAAALHIQGYRLGYAPKVCVRHVNIDRFALFGSYIGEFTDGECRFRLENKDEPLERFFGSPPEWNSAATCSPEVLALILYGLRRRLPNWRHMGGRPFEWISNLKDVFQFLSLRFFGLRIMLLRLRTLILLAKARCCLYWLIPEPMYRAFLDYWRRTTAFHRVRYLIEHPQPPATTKVQRLFYNLGDALSDRTFGFYGPEEYKGKHFRWSSSVAGIPLSLAPGRYEAKITLIPVRSIVHKSEVAVFANRMEVSPVHYEASDHTLRFELSVDNLACSEDLWLLFFIRPWNVPKRVAADERTLGLPIIAINFEPRNRRAECAQTSSQTGDVRP